MSTAATGGAGGVTQLGVLQAPISLISDWWEHVAPIGSSIITRLPEGWGPQGPMETQMGFWHRC